LVEVLSKTQQVQPAGAREEHIQLQCLKCLQILLNDTEAVAEILEQDNSLLKQVAESLDSPLPAVKVMVYELLAAIVLLHPDGYNAVLEAMDWFKYTKREQRRFLHLLETIIHEKSAETRVAALSFINCLINTPEDLDERVELRIEFVSLGLDKVVEKLKQVEMDEKVLEQVENYEQDANQDEEEYKERLGNRKINVKDPKDLFINLVKHIRNAAYLRPLFLSIMKSLVVMPTDKNSGLKCWLLATKFIHQLSAQCETINWDTGKAVELDELMMALDEDELEHLKETPNEAKQKLEEEVRKISEENDQFKTTVEKLKREIEEMKKNGVVAPAGTNPPDGDDAPLVASPPPGPGQDDDAPLLALGGPPPPPSGGLGLPPPPPPPMGGKGPPPPPPMGGKGPPPPPMGKGGGAGPNVPQGPQPTVPMKNLMWNKIPTNKVKKTVFAGMDWIKIDLPIKELEEQFSKKILEAKQDSKDTEKKKAKKISIVDPKRTQNVSIFLSKFKMESDVILKAVKDCDETVLNAENAQRLLVNLPQKEEMAAIKEYLQNGGTMDNLETVETFFVQLNEIPRIKTRMDCWLFKLTFPEKMGELRPALLKVDKAVRDMKRKGKNFLKVIEIILAVGNFMNGSTTRGNCMGFTLNSLMKISDTRSTDNKSTLLHYLVQYMEVKHPDVLKWTKELNSVRHATKVSYPAVAGEIANMKKNTASIEKKVQSVLQEEGRKPDNFDRIMPLSIERCKKEFEELEKLYDTVNENYKRLAEKFGENYKTTPPEVLFGMVAEFIHLFKKSRKEVKIQKAKLDKDRKRQLQQEKKKRELARKKRQRQEQQAKGERDKERERRRERRRQQRSGEGEGEGEGEKSEGDSSENPENDTEGKGPNENGGAEHEGSPMDTRDITDAITQLRSGKAFKRRRLRRQDTLRQQREKKMGTTPTLTDVFAKKSGS